MLVLMACVFAATSADFLGATSALGQGAEPLVLAPIPGVAPAVATGEWSCDAAWWC
jgi:hypothetical protein